MNFAKIEKNSKKIIAFIYILIISIIFSLRLYQYNKGEIKLNELLSKLEKEISEENFQEINKKSIKTNSLEEEMIFTGALDITKGNKEAGIENIKKAMELNGNKNPEIYIVGNKILADIYFDTKSYDIGAEYLYKSFKYIDEKYYNKNYKEILEAYVYGRETEVYSDTLINICTDIMDNIEYKNLEGRLDIQIALKNIYLYEDNYIQAIEYLVRSIELASKVENDEVYIESVKELSEINQKVLNKDIVLRKDNYFKFLIEDIYKETQLNEKLYENIIIYRVLIVFTILFCIVIIYIRNIKRSIKYDPLTKIYNRGYFDKRYYKLLNKRSKFSVIMIDIDNFKKLNDTYGHGFGDTVLVNCCAVINNFFNEGVEVFRYGGEEIAILLSNKSKKEVLMIAEGIRRVIEDLIWQDDMKVTVSLGIACSEEYGKDTLRKADENLYKAKNTGKNKVVFT